MGPREPRVGPLPTTRTYLQPRRGATLGLSEHRLQVDLSKADKFWFLLHTLEMEKGSKNYR